MCKIKLIIEYIKLSWLFIVGICKKEGVLLMLFRDLVILWDIVKY